jgi:hypothetical protein
MGAALDHWDISRTNQESVRQFFMAAPGNADGHRLQPGLALWELDLDREKGRDPLGQDAFSKDGGLAVLKGNIALDGCIVKTAGVDESDPGLLRPGAGVRKPGRAVEAILTNKIKEGDVVVIRYEGPKGGPGMQEMLYPTSYLKSKGLGKACALPDRRAVLGRHLGPVHRPCLARGGLGRRHRPGARRRHDRHRHSGPHHWPAHHRGRTGQPPGRTGCEGLEARGPAVAQRKVTQAGTARAYGFPVRDGLLRLGDGQGAFRRQGRGAGSKQAEWRTDPARAGVGGALGDIGTHAWNLAAFVAGAEPETLAADLSSFGAGRSLDDNAHVLLRYPDGARGMLWVSQVAPGNENALRLRIYGETGGLDWSQEDPNRLWFGRLGQPKQMLTRMGAGTGPAAARVSRVPAGHPEGYLEAFATIYAEAARAIRARQAARPEPEGVTYPGLSDGLSGMRFVSACVASHRRNGAWVRI